MEPCGALFQELCGGTDRRSGRCGSARVVVSSSQRAGGLGVGAAGEAWRLARHRLPYPVGSAFGLPRLHMACQLMAGLQR